VEKPALREVELDPASCLAAAVAYLSLNLSQIAVAEPGLAPISFYEMQASTEARQRSFPGPWSLQ
jgi:hypothetical protein